jgi:hypothetical protein
MGFFCQFYDIESLVIFPKISQTYTRKNKSQCLFEKKKTIKKILLKKNTITNELII